MLFFALDIAIWLWIIQSKPLQETILKVLITGINYEIIYGASNNTWKIYDTPYAYNLLNFVPADDASEHWRKE